MNSRKVICTDRDSIEHGVLVKSSYAVISIRDSGCSRAHIRHSSGLRAVLHVEFDDAEPATNQFLPPEVTLMTLGQATEIWRFVGEHREVVGAFVVLCHQGMSRSPAVA